MLSKKSYFNKTIFTKTVCRFWPLWTAYAAIWMTVMPFVLGVNLRNSTVGAWIAREIYESAIYGGVIIGAIAALASAMAVWSFLYNNRSTHGMAVLPIKREGVFLSVTLAGIVPYVAANLLVFVISAIVLISYGCVEFGALAIWFVTVTMIFIFFYGFAIFCAQMTGNIIILPIVYAVLNFTAIVVESIMKVLLSSFVYGMWETGTFKAAFLSPTVKYFQGLSFVDIRSEITGDTVGYTLEGMEIVAIYAVVGILFAIGAMMLYRRRRMESAGDVVAVEFLKPVFKYCLTGGCALVIGWVFYMLLEISNGKPNFAGMIPLIALMIAGAFVGYITAQMLIHKSFRIWKKGWSGFAVSVLAIIAVMAAMECDLFGYETYIPKTEKIESVYVSGNGSHANLTEIENIEAARALHKSIIEKKDRYESAGWGYNYGTGYFSYRSATYRITYTLKDGTDVERRYRIYCNTEDPAGYEDMLAVQNLVNTKEAIHERYAEFANAGSETELVAVIVRSNLPAAECARIKGYDSIERFALGYFHGIEGEEFDMLTDEQIDRHILEIAMEQGIISNGEKYSVEAAYDMPVSIYDVEMYSEEYYELAKYVNVDELWFQIEQHLDIEEAKDLWYNCMLPELRQGNLGEEFQVQDAEYENTVYDTYVEVNIRTPSEYTYDGYSHRAAGFTPTTRSVLTANWLRAHGFDLCLVGERLNATK